MILLATSRRDVSNLPAHRPNLIELNRTGRRTPGSLTWAVFAIRGLGWLVLDAVLRAMQSTGNDISKPVGEVYDQENRHTNISRQ